MGGSAVGPEHYALIGASFGCDGATARDIAVRARPVRFAARDTVVAVGEPGDDTWLLLTGETQALLYSVAGHAVLLHHFTPGDLFGGATGMPSAEDAEVVAVLPSDIGRIAEGDFILLMDRYRCVSTTVLRALTRRLGETTQRMVASATLSAAGRVHAELLRLARMGDGTTISPAPVLAELAMVVQSTRETVSRTVNALERSGVIRRSEDALVIVAPHRLEELIY